MDELHRRFADAIESGSHAPLLLAGTYVFDFLMIHPFNDGNGRMSRLLTLLILYHCGHEVGRFISLEKLVEESKETYYESLEKSTADWQALPDISADHIRSELQKLCDAGVVESPRQGEVAESGAGSAPRSDKSRRRLWGDNR
jgi:Fic family protein